jgi:hypothetical protein
MGRGASSGPRATRDVTATAAPSIREEAATELDERFVPAEREERHDEHERDGERHLDGVAPAGSMVFHPSRSLHLALGHHGGDLGETKTEAPGNREPL